MISDIPTYLLVFHCYLAFISVDVNDTPVYVSPGRTDEVHDVVLLNPYLGRKENQISISLKNEWGEPQRLDANCQCQLIETKNGTEKELYHWQWQEKKTGIGFKAYTRHFTLMSPGTDGVKGLTPPSPAESEALLKTLENAIRQKDSERVVAMLSKALAKSYESVGHGVTEWKAMETAFWKHIFKEEGTAVSLCEQIQYVHKANFIHPYGAFRNAPIRIRTRDKELCLDLILSRDDRPFIYAVNYILKQDWRKE